MATITTIQSMDSHYPPVLAVRDPHISEGTFELADLSHNHEALIEPSDASAASENASIEGNPMSKLQLTLTILQPSLINFFSSFTNGTITVALPIIATSLNLQRSLYLWPSSVYGLTTGAILLIAGSVADIIGSRPIELAGIFLLGVFTLACGFSQNGVQLVVFRALQGVAMAMHLPAAVAIIAAAVPPGRARNIGYGCLGLSQPLGFSFGMVISGVMIEKAGWRSAFWLSGGAILIAAAASWWTLPRVQADSRNGTVRDTLKKLWSEVDWVGGSIASGGLALLAYVLAMISADLLAIRTAVTASLLATSLILLIAFPLWMHYRERNGRPALVPNALWKNMPFASTCLMVAISYGSMNSMELFSSLYFQEVQKHSTLVTSLYLLPNLLVGVFINLSVGIFVHRLPARWLVAISSLLCSLAPMMMALVNPAWRYWYMELWAQVFAPMSGDVLFTVGLIIVSDNFPEKTQALAGAVFNTVAQFGTSLGVGLCQVVALRVMQPKVDSTSGGSSQGAASEDLDDMLKGYRAGFWTMFTSMIICGLIAIVGLKQAGKVGLKKD